MDFFKGRGKKGGSGGKPEIPRRKVKNVLGQVASKIIRSPYRPLDVRRQEIRLLEVKPGAEEDELRCRLFQIPLPKAEEEVYETISYVWGDPTALLTIEVNGSSFDVPLGAAEVLRRFREKKYYRFLWIDSVCINQADQAERSEQVSRMHEIYKRAEKNLIWLGPDDGTVGLAFHTYMELKAEMKYDLARHDAYHPHFYLQNRDNHGFSFPFDETPILSLFARPWFRRLWVVQEAAVAAESRCYCGVYEFDLSKLLRVFTWIVYKQNFLPKRLGTAKRNYDCIASLIDFVDKFGRYRGWNRQAFEGGSRREFLDWHKKQAAGSANGISRALQFSDFIEPLWHFQCSEPKDYVYAIVGLYLRFANAREVPPLLQPDYSRPLATILTDAARYSMLEAHDLNILEHSSRPRGDSWADLAMPSWTPLPQVLAVSGAPMTPFSAAFSAHARQFAKVSWNSVDPEILSAKGIPVDGMPAAYVATVSIPVTGDPKSLKAFLQEVIRLSQACATRDEDGSARKPLVETLYGGVNLENEAITERDMQEFDILVEYLAEHHVPPSWQRVNHTGTGYGMVMEYQMRSDLVSRFSTISEEVDEIPVQLQLRTASRATTTTGSSGSIRRGGSYPVRTPSRTTTMTGSSGSGGGSGNHSIHSRSPSRSTVATSSSGSGRAHGNGNGTTHSRMHSGSSTSTVQVRSPDPYMHNHLRNASAATTVQSSSEAGRDLYRTESSMNLRSVSRADTIVEYADSSTQTGVGTGTQTQPHPDLPNHVRSASAASTVVVDPDTGMDAKMRSASRASTAILKACQNRRYFLSASGRMGLGPANMRVGDVVVILYGGRFPFILRANGDEHELVGYSFVHGIMKGEMMEEHVEDGKEDTTFLIR
ncbi:hypothetical protein AC579_6797 [Pseudocercospora musae]|uniref:Heterokaryon incompatibility domain-containing protein n=1 Tax=Pseudocercospora musae TaxID=113226 RepID=A0A139IQE7_9PEZI|nr:hypothetical protein AC579_6797 [Pseudocercospora musae]